MLYLRICFDKPAIGNLRNELRSKHREYLQSFSRPGALVSIYQAGPMCVDDKDDTNIGSFLIIEANSLKDAQRFHDEDPFSVAGLYDEVRLVRWDRHINNS